MIDPGHDLPIKQQAEVLGISRSTVYYEPRPVSAEDLWLMRRIDELHLNSLLSGYKLNRFNWLQISPKSLSQSVGWSACEMGVFSNRVRLRICRIW